MSRSSPGADAEGHRSGRPDVLDMWAPIVPTREIMAHVATNVPEELLQYVEVFTKRRVTAEEYATLAPAAALDDEEILADLDRSGIRHSVVTGFDELSTCGKTFVSNHVIAAVAERHPSRFTPFAGIDIMAGERSLAELEYWVTERGFRGLSLRPFMIKRPASDPAYVPVYRKCVELGIPISIHTSANWTRTSPSSLGHPSHVDEVACQFPELVLIMSHAGYPWVLEACLVAWKHANVYLEIAAHRPRYFASAGSGWEALMRLGQTTIADKVLYGTGAFLLGRPYADLVEEMCELPVPPEILRRWLWTNGAALLRLEQESGTAV